MKHYGSARASGGERLNVLEVGSKAYDSQQTYRPLFDPAHYNYQGLDVEAGPNVDIVPANGYVWNEIANETFDLCISGQTFEHNPFFWATFAEVARILKSGGHALIVAPGGGPVHRYPYDCWRFYPDAWLGLCSLTGLELVESYFESDGTAMVVPGGAWRDSAVVARKPFIADDAKESFYAKLRSVVAPFEGKAFELEPQRRDLGPCFAEYEQNVLANHSLRPLQELRKRLTRKSTVKLLTSKALHGG